MLPLRKMSRALPDPLVRAKRRPYLYLSYRLRSFPTLERIKSMDLGWFPIRATPQAGRLWCPKSLAYFD